MLNTIYEPGSIADKELSRTDKGYTRAFIQTKATSEGYKARIVIENKEWGVGYTSKVIRSNISIPMAKAYLASL